MNALFQLIQNEAETAGKLPFARFMELALYHPELGYYEQKNDPGRRGDFYTSVSVGALFGELLAFQFAEWLEVIPMAGGGWRMIEAGAHAGQLAKDILSWLQRQRPKIFERLEYIVIEPSPRRQEWQRETLAEFGNKIRWLAQISELKNPQSAIRNPQSAYEIIFSNELLDAMPVRRFGWDAKNKKWFEWGVAVESGKFVWAKIPNSESPTSVRRLPSSLLDVLPDGYTIETSPAAENWWRKAAHVLKRGKLLTMDYGLTADEWLSPARTNGTLRAYFRHHASDDLLAHVGEQDLTAHVNFSTIQKAGEDAGLKTEFFSTQSKFLTEILAKTQRDKTFGEWNSARVRQFQTLTHPEHLGRAFRVLVQSR
jgi:SAM-dependent MidA family methyltransferase